MTNSYVKDLFHDELGEIMGRDRLDCDWMTIGRCVEGDGHLQSRGGSLGHCAPTRQL